MERRVAAIVLPDLACELVRQRVEVTGPLGVIIEDLGEGEPALATAVLDAVDEEARRLGVRPGQRVVEAAALAAHLSVHRVPQAQIEAALGRVAEIALVFGPTAALRLAGGEGSRIRAGGVDEEPFDTVWLDVTGTAHLVGGEEALIHELIDRVGKLGHRAQVAIAGGPRIAQALARWSRSRPSGASTSPLARLPVQALPIDGDVAKFLTQLGISTIGELANLPSAAVAARLGPYASDVMSLMRGIDEVPLFPYEPPHVLSEEITFEEGVESTEPLLFVLRGMTSRLCVRLASRGEACSRLDVTIPYDRSIARLRLKERGDLKEETEELCLRLAIDLPAPLSEEADLLRALKAKLERAELRAPAVGLRLELSQIVGARRVQLDLSRDVAIDPDRLPALLAELSAEIGAERVGVLEILDAHRPEARSRLAPADLKAPPAALPPEDSGPPEGPSEPTRLLPEPVPIGRVELGRTVTIEGQAFVIERLRFEMRLQSVEWWTETPASRDYARAWLVAAKPTAGPRSPLRKGGAPPGEPPPRLTAEAWIFVDRTTGEGYLQGWSE
ncbi:MAG TPA: DNA polymerase Y family protein [Polyangiaceae bacterium]|nr:DNA polymerase Y family protein [Polyangiaceae bacterium]